MAEEPGRSDDGTRAGSGEAFRVRREMGVLGPRQRRLAWLAFVTLALHAPFVAYSLPDDTWMLSIVVACMVAFVIVVDDIERRKPSRETSPGGE